MNKAFLKLKSILYTLRCSAYVLIFCRVWDRVRLFTLIGANLIYISWNIIFAVVYDDSLLLTMSVYYFLLLIMRYVLLRSANDGRETSFFERPALAVGILMLPAVLMMGSVMVYTLTMGVKKNYSPLSLIPQSVFSFCCFSGALIRIIRHKKEDGQQAIGMDAISLAVALFSIFNLVNYLTHIGVPFFERDILLIVGLASVIIVLASAIVLIIKSKKTG